MSDWFPPDTPASSSSIDGIPAEPEPVVPAVREGLPPTFKMRHDRHYVDELESRSPGVLVRMLPTSEIQLRTPVEFDHGAPLVESVRRLGVLQPILVRRAAAGYELIAGTRRVAAACAAGLTEVPCRVYAVDDREAQVLAEADDLRAFPAGVRPAAELTGSSDMQRQAATFVPMLGELTDSLRAAASCWDLCADAADRPYATVVRDVTRVELQRATWLVQGLQVLGEQPAMNRTRVNVGVLLEQSFRLTRAERRLADITLSSDLGDRTVVARADEALLSMAFGSLMGVFVAVVRPCSSAAIRCALSMTDELALVEMSESSIGVPEALVTQFSDLTFPARPGGHIAGVNAAAVTRVVDLHGGRLTVEALQPQGLRVSIALPL